LAPVTDADPQLDEPSPPEGGDASASEPAAAEAPLGGADWSEAPRLVGSGFCMGTADVVPGVSGGTMALVLGIYARLVEAIRSIDAEAVRHLLGGRFRALLGHVAWRFLGLIVVGQAIGVVVFTKLIPLPKLIHSHPEAIYGLFFGFIVGSIWLLGRNLLDEAVSRRVLVAAGAGALAGFAVANLSAAGDATTAAWTESPWFVFLCGCISICAMILPGISGSFVLLLLRKYAYVLGHVGEVIHPSEGGSRLTSLVEVVGPFALGCLVGLLSFARLLGWLLQRFERETLGFMTGLMAGSLWLLWPFQDRITKVVRGKERLVGSSPTLPDALDGTTALAGGLLLVGIAAVVALDLLARKRPPVSSDG
jgi:putative membrane protein